MPVGLFLIVFDAVKGMKIHAKHAVQGTTLSDDQVNRIFMSHASGKDGEKMSLKVENMHITTMYMQREVNKVVERAVVAVVLNKGENPESFHDVLDDLRKDIWVNMDKPPLKMTILLQEAYTKMAQHAVTKIDPEVIRKRVIARAQDMLGSNQIDQAQQLLGLSKSIPQQLVQAHNDGHQFRAEKRYDKSQKSFEDAKRFAQMLVEPELADDFDRNAKRSAEIPTLERAKEKALDTAKDLLRREEFLGSSNKFREVADICDKLGDVVGKEINGKKAEILGKYAEIDSLAY